MSNIIVPSQYELPTNVDAKTEAKILKSSFNDPKDVNNLQFILRDIMQGDDSLRNRPEYAHLNMREISIALKWLSENSEMDDALKASLITEPWRLNFKMEPPTPKSFLAEMYLGPMIENLWHPIKRNFVDFFDPMKSWRTAIFCSSIGSGKAQPLETEIKTISGTTRIGDLQLDDRVLTPDGSYSKVIELHPIERIDCYEIKFNDERIARCSAYHLWKVCYQVDGKGKDHWEVVDTRFIIEHPDESFKVPTYEGEPVTIVNVRFIGRRLQRCITIENPDGLYINENGIITHNSTLTCLIYAYISVCFALMWNPHKTFAKLSTTIFALVFCAVSQKKGSEVYLESLLQLYESSPFFKRLRTHHEMKEEERKLHENKIVEYIPFTTSTPSSSLQSGNGLNYKLISSANALLGVNILGGAMTELSFFHEAGWAEEKIRTFFTKLRQRIANRFSNSYWARMILDSSPNSTETFPDSWIFGEARESPDNFFFDGSRWDIFPEEFSDVFPVVEYDETTGHITKLEGEHTWENSFKLYKGGNGKLPVVCESQGVSTQFEVADMIWVPRHRVTINGTENFVAKANENPIDFMRDICGIPSGSRDRLFYLNDSIENCFNNGLKNMYGAIKAPHMEDPEHLIWNQIAPMFFYKIMDKYFYYYAPEVARCISVDQSKSKDVTCIAMSHAERDVTRIDSQTKQPLTVYVTDFTIYIVPKGGLINLDAIKFFIYDLRRLGNLNIRHVSFDGYESEPTKQFLMRQGFDIDYLSVDKNNDPYMTFYDLVMNRRWFCGRNAFLKNNMKSLHMAKRKQSGSVKVDHFLGELVYDWTGDWATDLCGVNAKDGTDAVTGTLWLMGVYSEHFPASRTFDPNAVLERTYESVSKSNTAMFEKMGYISRVSRS